MIKWLRSFLIPSPARKPSKKMLIIVSFAARAQLRVVIITVLFPIDACSRTFSSSLLGSSQLKICYKGEIKKHKLIVNICNIYYPVNIGIKTKSCPNLRWTKEGEQWQAQQPTNNAEKLADCNCPTYASLLKKYGRHRRATNAVMIQHALTEADLKNNIRCDNGWQFSFGDISKPISWRFSICCKVKNLCKQEIRPPAQ